MQEFGSQWDWVIKNVFPALQLMMTLAGSALGAGIGGWVAIKTTTRALEAASERERIARDEAAHKKRVEELRGHSERYLQLMWKIFAFEVGLATKLCDLASGKIPSSEAKSTRTQPPPEMNSELMMLEHLHLDFLAGTTIAFGNHLHYFGVYVGGEIRKILSNPNGISKELAGDYFFETKSRTDEMQSFMADVAAKLRAHIKAAEYELMAVRVTS